MPNAESPKVQKMLRSTVLQKYSPEVSNRAVALFKNLSDALEDIDGTDFLEWTKNCGRNVSHHSGFIPICRRSHVLQSGAVKSGGLRLSSRVWQYKLRGISTAALKKLCDIIQVSDKMHAKLEGYELKTCTDWCSAFGQCMGIAMKESAPGLTGYLAKWTVRCMLLNRLYRQGRKLVPGSCTWRDFCKAGPDQKCNMQVLSGYRHRRRNILVKALLKDVGYKAPPELVSMYLCFLNGISHYSTEALEKKIGEMSAYRREFKRTRGMNPIFADVVRECM